VFACGVHGLRSLFLILYFYSKQLQWVQILARLQTTDTSSKQKQNINTNRAEIRLKTPNLILYFIPSRRNGYKSFSPACKPQISAPHRSKTSEKTNYFEGSCYSTQSCDRGAVIYLYMPRGNLWTVTSNAQTLKILLKHKYPKAHENTDRSGKENKIFTWDVLLQEIEAASNLAAPSEQKSARQCSKWHPWWNGPSGRMQLSLDPAISDHLCSIKKESQWYT